LTDLRTAKTSQEDLLRQWEKTKALLDERIRLQGDIAAEEGRLSDKEDRRRGLLADAWKGLLSSRIRTTRLGIEKDLQDKRDSYQRVVVSANMAEKLRKALDEGACTTCGQDLSDAAKNHLADLLSEVIPKEDRADLEEEVQKLESRIAALRKSESISNVDILQEVQEAIDEIKIQKATAEDRLSEIKEQTKDLDEAEMRKQYSKYEKTIAEIGILQPHWTRRHCIDA
jgi:hypothetical protein